MSKTKNFGVRVSLWFRPESVYGLHRIELRNVTEIHYNYPRQPNNESKAVAFESNIHETGILYDIADILEFETSLESSKSTEGF